MPQPSGCRTLGGMKRMLLIPTLMFSMASAKETELAPRATAMNSLQITSRTVLPDGRQQVEYLMEQVEKDGRVVPIAFVVRTKPQSRVIHEFQWSDAMVSLQNQPAVDNLFFQVHEVTRLALNCFGLPKEKTEVAKNILQKSLRQAVDTGQTAKYRKMIRDVFTEVSSTDQKVTQLLRLEKMTRPDHCVVPK